MLEWIQAHSYELHHCLTAGLVVLLLILAVVSWETRERRA